MVGWCNAEGECASCSRRRKRSQLAKNFPRDSGFPRLGFGLLLALGLYACGRLLHPFPKPLQSLRSSHCLIGPRSVQQPIMKPPENLVQPASPTSQQTSPGDNQSAAADG
jgi:hypothetical protein